VTTEIEETRISAADLRVGMFVCRLDRPWEGTPFPLQGVELRTLEDVRAMRDLCEYVYIDSRREVVDHSHLLKSAERRPEQRFVQVTRYPDKVSVEEELPSAHEALGTATEMVDRIYADVASGRDLSVEHVESAVRPLVASVLRSADAFLYLEGLRKHDSYTYSHAIGCSALAAAMGRHMGLHEDTVFSLAAGGLLMDIGKTRVPEELLQSPRSLAPEEFAIVRGHIGHGIAILQESGINNPDVHAVLRSHHERYDGSGYPERLIGGTIPMPARILGIIDSYDAMISVRPYRAAISRHHALQQIYRARNTLFQAELIEQFQACLGVYPTGSLVELNSGEIAMVMMQNRVRRLRPRVLLLTTPDKQPLKDFQPLDLLNQPNDNDAIGIVRSVAAGEYAIDTTGLLPD
jgi:HD-GYP domain-containing protein (c-di-GMP phosphodiesterase class II)